MNRWKWLKIKDVCKFIGGSQPPKTLFSSVFQKGYVRLVQTRDFKTNNYITYIPQNSTNKFFGEKDIMIGRYGPPIFQIFRGLEGAYNVALLKAKPLDIIDNDFLYYFLLQKHIFTYVDQLSARTGGQTGVDLESLYEYPIKLPPLSAQQKIASVLSALDSKIRLNNKINKELEEMAKTLYDYWFVQFDFPDKNGKPYKSSGGKMAYSEKLKRDTPVGWEVESLNNLTLLLVRGISPKYVEDRGIPVLNQKCIRNKSIDFSLARKHDDISKKVDSKLIQVGDILVNSTGVGTLGRVAIVKRLEESITTVDSHITIVRFDHKKANPVYMGYALTERQSDIEQFGLGSTGQTELSRESLGKLQFIIPENEIQHCFEKILKPLFQKMAVNEKQNQELISLRDWLLPMILNGQVKVADSSLEKEETAKVVSSQLPMEVKQVSLPIPANKIGFAKQVLAGKIVSLFKDDSNFTDIKFQKVQFLAEHVIQADLNLNYYYQTAGPYDNRFMHTIYNDFKKNNWFERKGKKYTFLKNKNKIDEYYQVFFKPVVTQLERLFGLLSSATEAESEILATLYAVWNNRIIEGKSFKDDELTQDFYRWSERKKLYSETQIRIGLKWLRDNRMEPTGFGKLIKESKGKR